MTAFIWIAAAAYAALYVAVNMYCGRSKESRPEKMRVDVHMHVHAPRQRRSIVQNVKASQQAERRARRASLDRRYYRGGPW